MILRCNIDKTMVNTGTKVKPFILAAVEHREYLCGPIRYCTIQVEKNMANIGDDITISGGKPYFVKIFELIRVRIFGIQIRYREQSWKYDKL